MKSDPAPKATISKSELTGLRWPRTWKGAYLLVIGSFALWLTLLIALTEFSK